MITIHTKCTQRERCFLSRRSEVWFCEVAIANWYRSEHPASLIEVRWLLFIDADEIVKNSGGDALYEFTKLLNSA
jgi:hypothetical protein